MIENSSEKLMGVYSVKEKLGDGGFGTVYRVVHDTLALDMAVKIIKKDILKLLHGDLHIFLQECNNWIDLDIHACIVTCYYVRTINHNPCIFMDFIKEGSLDQWIRNWQSEKPVNHLEQILIIAWQIASGLSFIHSKSLIHQDIKPENILMDRIDGQFIAKISDFTLSTKMNKNGKGAFWGMSEEFCSPEQKYAFETRQNSPIPVEISFKTDLWSWALVVLSMYTNKIRSIRGKATQAFAILNQYAEESQNDTSLTIMPSKLYELMKECFKDEPDQRPNTMSDVVKRIEQIYQEIFNKQISITDINEPKLNAINYNNKAVSYWDLWKIDNNPEFIEKTTKYLENAIVVDPSYLISFYNITMIRWLYGAITEPSDMIKTLKHEININHDRWLPYYLLGMVYKYQLNPSLAKEMFEKTLSMNPFNIHAEEIKKYLSEINEGESAFPYKDDEFEGHTDEILCLAVFPKGSKAISASRDKTLRLWDLKEKRCIAVLAGHEDEITSVCISTCGQYAASGDFDGNIFYWDILDKKLIGAMKTVSEPYEPVGILTLAFFNGNQNMISGGFGKKIRIWDVAKKECIHVFEAHNGPVDHFNGSIRVNSICINPKGNLAVSTGSDRQIKVWDLLNFQCKRTIKNNGFYSAFADVNASNLLLTANNDGSIEIIDMQNGTVINQFHGHTSALTCARFMGDTGYVLSSCKDGEIKIWDYKRKNCILTLNSGIESGYYGGSLALSPDNLCFIIAAKNNIQLWYVNQIAPVNPSLILDNLRKSQDQIKVSSEFTKFIHDIERHIQVGEWEQALNILRYVKTTFVEYKRNDLVRDLWSRLYQGGEIHGIEDLWYEGSLSVSGNTSGSLINCIDILKNSDMIIAADSSGIFYEFCLKTKRTLRICHTNMDGINNIKFIGPDRVITGHRSGVVALWNLQNLEMLSCIEFESFSAITDLDYSSTTGLALVGTGGIISKSLYICNLNTREKLIELKESDETGAIFGSIHSAIFSISGKYAITGDHKGIITVWDIEGKSVALKLLGHTSKISYLRDYMQGSRLVSTSEDGEIRIWELEFGGCLSIIKGVSKSSITSAILSSDEAILAIMREEEVIEFFSMNSMKFIHSIKGQQGSNEFRYHKDFNGFILTHDLRHLITGGSDRTISIWGIDWEYTFQKMDTVSPLKNGIDAFRTLVLPDQAEVQVALNFGHSNDITTLTISGLRVLISGSYDNTIKVWDLLQNGLCINTLTGHTDKITAILTASYGKEILSSSQDGTVIVWDVYSGMQRQVLNQGSAVHALALCNELGLIACGCENGCLNIWDLKSGILFKTIKYESSVESLLATSSNQYLFIGTGEGSVVVVDTASWHQRKTFHYNNGITKMKEYQQNIYIGVGTCCIEIVDAKKIKPVRKISVDCKVTDFYVDGNELVVCSFALARSSVVVIDLKTGKIKRESEKLGWAKVIAYYFNGYCFIGLSKGNILLMNTNTMKLEGCIFGQDDPVCCVKISSDKRYVISGSYKCFRIFDLYTGKLTEIKDERNIIDVDFSSDCKFAYAENYDGTVYQVRLSTMQIEGEYPYAHLGNINTMTATRSMNPDTFEYNHMIIAMRDETGIRFFKRLKEDALINTLEDTMKDILFNSKIRYMVNGQLSPASYGGVDTITFIDMYKKDIEIDLNLKNFQMDGYANKILVCWESGKFIAHDSKKINLIEMNTQRVLQTFVEDEGQYNISQSVLYNDNTLITGGVNGKIKFWNVNTGKKTAEFIAHQCSISAISISADRTLIITGGSADGIKIWSMSGFQLIASIAVLDKNDYAIFTPQNELFISNPKYLQFFKIKKSLDETIKTLITDEKERLDCIQYFNDIEAVRSKIEEVK